MAIPPSWKAPAPTRTLELVTEVATRVEEQSVRCLFLFFFQIVGIPAQIGFSEALSINKFFVSKVPKLSKSSESFVRTNLLIAFHLNAIEIEPTSSKDVAFFDMTGACVW